MKFTKETMDAAQEHFMGVPFWRDVYENAPEKAKERLRVAFWGSRHLDEREDLDNYRAYRESVESEMTYEDAAYLAEKFPEGAGKTHYTELRDNLEMAAEKTVEKLDEAMDIMVEDWSTADREIFEKTRRAMKDLLEDPFIKYEWLWKAVGGSGEDCIMMGDMFEHGHGTEPNDDIAFFWFRKAALSGSGDGCCRLAAIYEREGAPRFDMVRALFWFKEAMRRRSVEAKIDLGARLTVWDEGLWPKYRNPELGFQLLKSASKEKDGERALFYLGRCYEDGIGTPRHLEFARIKYRKAMFAGVHGAKEANDRVIELLKAEKYNQGE